MRVLVTGANGYIGSKVVRQLCDLNVEVIATDFSNNHIDSRALFIQDDLFSLVNYEGSLTEHFHCPDVCLHLAWRDGFVHNSDKHMGDLSSHYLFLKRLIDEGIPQVAVMGSMHEVGYYEGEINDNTPCNPVSMYGIAKNALRQSVELYSKNHDCRFLWLRGFYIYGEDDFGNSIFCKIRKAAKEGQKTFPFTTGTNKYDFMSVDDLAKQISFAVIQKQVLGIVNVCSGKPVSLKDQVEWYIHKNNLPIVLDYGKFPDRPYDSPCIYGDPSKIRKIIDNFEKKKVCL